MSPTREPVSCACTEHAGKILPQWNPDECAVTEEGGGGWCPLERCRRPGGVQGVKEAGPNDTCPPPHPHPLHQKASPPPNHRTSALPRHNLVECVSPPPAAFTPPVMSNLNPELSNLEVVLLGLHTCPSKDSQHALLLWVWLCVCV